MQEIITAISTVGFPIAMCLLTCWFVVKQQETHKEEMKSMTDALANNTLALQKLTDKLEKGEILNEND